MAPEVSMQQGTRVHAFGDDALGELDAVAVAHAIASGEISAREAAEAAIARAEQVDGALNAVVALDRTLVERDNHRSGPFAGVPTFIKDNVHAEGLPSTQGSRAIKAMPSPNDDAVVGQFRATGVSILGTSRMPEFGLSASTEYANDEPTHNPWDLSRSSGASSGGAAALVAAGVVPLAHGNDGGGSLRIPAACCGLVGLKPTRGRMAPANEAAIMPVDIITNGVMTRSVRDTAVYMHAAEQARRSPDLPPIGLVEGPNSARRRIGLVLDSPIGTPTDSATRLAVLNTAEELQKAGHAVFEIDPPVDQGFAEAFIDYWGLLALSLHRMGPLMFPRRFSAGELDPLTTHMSAQGARNLWRIAPALARLNASRAYYTATFDKVDIDAVLCPVTAHVTPKLGDLAPRGDLDEMFARLVAYACFTPVNNASGTPAISLPLGSTDEGLPVGVHLMGRFGDERTLLELAFELEAAMPFARIQD